MIGQAKSSQEGPSLSSAVSTQAFVNKGPQGTLLPPYTLPVSTNSLLTSRQAVNNQAGPSILGGYAPASEQYAVPSHHQGSGLIPITPLTLQAFPTQVGSQTTHIWALKRLTTMLSGIWSMPLRFQKTLNLVPPPIYSTNSLPTSRQATDYQPYLNSHEQEERRDWSLWRV